MCKVNRNENESENDETNKKSHDENLRLLFEINLMGVYSMNITYRWWLYQYLKRNSLILFPTDKNKLQNRNDLDSVGEI